MSRKLTPEEKAARAKSRNIARLDRKLIEYWKWRQDNLDLRHLPTLHELHELHGNEFGDRMMAQDFGTDVDTLRQRRRALMPPEFAALVAEIRPLMKPVNKAIEKHKLARRKVEKKLERERWWKDHPQWRLADLDRVLEHPTGQDADEAAIARYEAAWLARDKWSLNGTPMTAEVLGPPTRTTQRDSEAR